MLTRLFNAVGLVVGLITVSLGLVIVGILLLGVLAVITGSLEAGLGAAALAVMVAIPTAIIFVVALAVRASRAPQMPPPPPPALPPSATGRPGGVPQDQVLYNPNDLR